jgi:UDP-glucuronate 4-epimerase
MDFFKHLPVVVTGGAGFIGSHLCERLLELEAQVAAVDNFDPYYDPAEKRENLTDCLRNPRFRLIEGDIRDAALLRRKFADFRPRIIVHLAAKAGVRPSLADPEAYADTNVRGTTVLLEAARQAKVNNFVFASSSSVYGASDSLPFREDHRTDRPLSPYGATKKAGEVLCHAYHSAYGMNVSCLRFFTVYGPRQRPDLAIRKFVRLALAGQPVPVYGDGTSSRDYTHVRDTLTGILGAIQWGESRSPRFDIFNLGSSQPIQLNDLVSAIEQELGHPIERQHLAVQPGDMTHTYADTTLAERELGFRRTVDFRDGLREFILWMKQRKT